MYSHTVAQNWPDMAGTFDDVDTITLWRCLRVWLPLILVFVTLVLRFSPHIGKGVSGEHLHNSSADYSMGTSRIQAFFSSNSGELPFLSPPYAHVHLQWLSVAVQLVLSMPLLTLLFTGLAVTLAVRPWIIGTSVILIGAAIMLCTAGTSARFWGRPLMEDRTATLEQ